MNMSSVEQANAAVVRRFYEEVFNQGKEDVIDEVIAPNYKDYGHNPPGEGPEGAKTDYRGGAAVFQDTHYTIDDLIAVGDQVVVRWTGTYKHTGELLGIAPTNRQISLTGISLYRVADGKITETRNGVNWLNLLVDLGAIKV